MTYYKVRWLLYNTEESYLAPHFLSYNFRSGDRKTLFSDKKYVCVWKKWGYKGYRGKKVIVNWENHIGVLSNSISLDNVQIVCPSKEKGTQ